MTEKLVIVRAYGQKPLIRAILAVLQEGALVCMPEDAEAIRAGRKPEPMLGFPKKDLFRYDGAVAGLIAKGTAVDWAKLTPLMH